MTAGFSKWKSFINYNFNFVLNMEFHWRSGLLLLTEFVCSCFRSEFHFFPCGNNNGGDRVGGKISINSGCMFVGFSITSFLLSFFPMPPKKKISKPAKVSLKRKAEVLSGSDNERPDDKPHRYSLPLFSFTQVAD
jgi:hypothetical protein